MGGAMLTFRNILGVVVMAAIFDTGMSCLMFSNITIEKCLISITRLTKNTRIVRKFNDVKVSFNGEI